jgi:hypothetical protein
LRLRRAIPRQPTAVHFGRQDGGERQFVGAAPASSGLAGLFEHIYTADDALAWAQA